MVGRTTDQEIDIQLTPYTQPSLWGHAHTGPPRPNKNPYTSIPGPNLRATPTTGKPISSGCVCLGTRGQKPQPNAATQIRLKLGSGFRPHEQQTEVSARCPPRAQQPRLVLFDCHACVGGGECGGWDSQGSPLPPSSHVNPAATQSTLATADPSEQMSWKWTLGEHDHEAGSSSRRRRATTFVVMQPGDAPTPRDRVYVPVIPMPWSDV